MAALRIVEPPGSPWAAERDGLVTHHAKNLSQTVHPRGVDVIDYELGGRDQDQIESIREWIGDPRSLCLDVTGWSALGGGMVVFPTPRSMPATGESVGGLHGCCKHAPKQRLGNPKEVAGEPDSVAGEPSRRSVPRAPEPVLDVGSPMAGATCC